MPYMPFQFARCFLASAIMALTLLVSGCNGKDAQTLTTQVAAKVGSRNRKVRVFVALQNAKPLIIRQKQFRWMCLDRRIYRRDGLFKHCTFQPVKFFQGQVAHKFCHQRA